MHPEPPLRTLQDIRGWFARIDQAVFEHFLSDDSVMPRGDLVELGTYLGKSAVLIGRFKRPDETFTVCDLFGIPPGDDPNRLENRRYYTGLARQQFERNYLTFFEELPVIVQDYSSAIVNHVPPGSARFVHVDASHQYEHVVVDVESARTILKPNGVAVFDDYRHEHTPGAAAAVWEAVLTKGLHCICLTPHKLYGTFGDPEPHRHRLETWLKETGRFHWEPEYIAGATVIRVAYKKQPKKAAGPASHEPAGAKAQLRRLGAAATRRLPRQLRPHRSR